MARFTKILLGIVLIGLFFIGCAGEDAVNAVLILSEPQYDTNFATNGRFTISMIAITEDSSVITIDKADQVEFDADSASNDSTYTITIVSVTFVSPSADKIAVGLLLDSSGSMSSNDPLNLRVSSSKTFIKKLLGDKSTHMASVADFSAGSGDEYYFRLLQEYVNVSDTVNLFAGLDSVTEAGLTPLYTAVHRDLDHTDSVVSASQYSRALLALTDGIDNDSYAEDTLGAVISVSQQKDIPVYVVGLGTGVNEIDLQRLANETSGVYAHASSADALDRIFTAMGLGLSQGYTTTVGSFDPIPPSGTIVYVTVIITSGGQSATATIIFVIP